MLDELNRSSVKRNSDVYAFAEQMLLNRIFHGDYQEKRYVNKLNTYKDLIVLNNQEQILCDDLTKVKNQILNELPNVWFGYTTPYDHGAPPVYCIWTTLDEQSSASAAAAVDSLPKNASVGFGEYWFQIKGIHLGMNMIEIHTTILRPIEPQPAHSSIGPTISTLAQQALEVDSAKIQQYVQENIVNVNWMELFQQWCTTANQMTYRFISNEITWANFIHCIKLLGILTVAFIKWSCQFVRSLGEFTIRLIIELNKLVKTSTPIVLAILSLFSKIFGGLYILLAMIWRDLFDGDSNRQRKNPNESQRPGAGGGGPGGGGGRIRAPPQPITYRDYTPRNYRPGQFYSR